MDGIEKITAKIAADAQAEIDRLTAEAKAEADAITAAAAAKAQAITAELTAQGERAAAEREERMTSVAHLDARNSSLAAKQTMLDKAFELALNKLCALEDEAYVELLAKLLIKASRTGKEQVAFNQKDRDRVGKAAVARANEMLAKAVAPKLPDELANTKVGAFVDRVVSGVSAIAQGTAMLTLAADTRNIQGGFILVDGRIETNCAFETLVRLERSNMAGEVAKTLFD